MIKKITENHIFCTFRVKQPDGTLCMQSSSLSKTVEEATKKVKNLFPLGTILSRFDHLPAGEKEIGLRDWSATV